MNIIQIIPGSGGSFYCGNCLRDSKLFDAFRRSGHNVLKIPMYLPLFSDEHDIAEVPVFYGAISLYLKQKYPFLQNAPSWFDKIFNSKPMMRLAAGMAGSTRSEGLEEMTISMLLGEEGKQKIELDKMVDWIADNCNPDIIHLSNALLLGLAHKLKKRLNVPIICSLQDEDVWIDGMNDNYRERVWKLMHDKSADVDAFVAVSDFYANVSIQRMNLNPSKVHTIHLGVDSSTYNFIPATRKKRNIGFISRMCHENGLDILIDAFVKLREDNHFDDVNLHITGGSTDDDHEYIKGLKQKVESLNLRGFCHFWQQFEGEHRKRFFEQVAIVSVPVRKGEAFGIYLIEAMASGIPVVQPKLGAFPEIVDKAKGGVIYEMNNSIDLSRSLATLLGNSSELDRLSVQARKGVEESFNIDMLISKLIKLYKEVSTH